MIKILSIFALATAVLFGTVPAMAAPTPVGNVNLDLSTGFNSEQGVVGDYEGVTTFGGTLSFTPMNGKLLLFGTIDGNHVARITTGQWIPSAEYYATTYNTGLVYRLSPATSFQASYGDELVTGAVLPEMAPVKHVLSMGVSLRAF